MHPSQVFAQAVSAFQTGQLGEAERGFKKFLRKEPRHFGALNLYAALLIQSERFDEAEPLLDKATTLNAQSDKTFYNYGLVLKKLNKFEAAFEAFTKAIAINPNDAESWNNRGTVLNDLMRHEEAIRDFDQALSLVPDYAEAISNKGSALIATQRLSDAIKAYDEAIRLRPNLPKAWVGRGLVLLKQSQYEEADAAFERALKIDPSSDTALTGRGLAMQALGHDEKAFVFFEDAVRLKDNSAKSWLSFGLLCIQWGWPDQAETIIRKAIRLDPGLADGWLALGDFHGVAGDWAKALAGHEAAIKINPDLDYARGGRMHAAAHVCLWEGAEADWARCIEGVRQGLPVIHPFALMAVPGATAADQLLCATHFIQKLNPPNQETFWRGERYDNDRIRIAYISGDFREHAVAALIAGMLEHHDRSKFRTIGFSLAPESSSSMGQRTKNALDEFHDVSKKSSIEIAGLVHSMKADIAVDLCGFTSYGRPGIFAFRPAPVQVNYLGFPATMGAGYMDYIIGDHVIMPAGHDAFYSEKIVRLPDAYQPNDNTRPLIAAPTKTEAGLPENGFVFCCFNNNYKITPDVFDVWMRLLAKTEGSVLWLLAGNKDAHYNLGKEAEARGVAPERIIFAPRVSGADHIARHQLADLFLDTLYYNAHTTASDALWAGLPVLTRIGQTFASRVAASLLTAVGLPELITTSLEDYEALALKLARDPAPLAAVKAKLAANRLTTPLFDTARYTRHLETAYIAMHERTLRGEKPESFSVKALPA